MRLRIPPMLLAAISLVLRFSSSPAGAGELVPGRMTPGSAEVKSDTGGKTEMAYYTALPEGPAPPDGWPLMVFLHGSGERGTDLEDVRRNGPPKLFGKMKELNSFMIITPQCPDGRWWDTVALKDLIDQTVALQPVDPSRIYLTGISMGGFGVWDMLKAYPNFFAAAIPMCGGGDPKSAKRFKNIPIWMFHGSQDQDVPIQRSLEMNEALRRAGGNPTFTLYPDAGHDCWTRTYDDPEIYEWLLHQQRPETDRDRDRDSDRDHERSRAPTPAAAHVREAEEHPVSASDHARDHGHESEAGNDRQADTDPNSPHRREKREEGN